MPKMPSEVEVKNQKRAAHAATTKALRSRRLVPRACQNCLSPENIHAHHEDYEKPLEVLWLCASCHKRLHHGKISVEDLHVLTETLNTKSPPAFVRVHPKDYRTIKRLAAARGLPVSTWMRTVILDRLGELDRLEKERSDGK